MLAPIHWKYRSGANPRHQEVAFRFYQKQLPPIQWKYMLKRGFIRVACVVADGENVVKEIVRERFEKEITQT